MQKLQETRVRYPGWEDPPEKEMATPSSTLAWEILSTEEAGGLWSTMSQSQTWLSRRARRKCARPHAEIQNGHCLDPNKTAQSWREMLTGPRPPSPAFGTLIHGIQLLRCVCSRAISESCRPSALSPDIHQSIWDPLGKLMSLCRIREYSAGNEYLEFWTLAKGYVGKHTVSLNLQGLL